MGDFTVNVRQKPMDFNRWQLGLLRDLPDALTNTEFEAVADQLGDELTACGGPHAPLLSDHAVSRAGIYEDHP